MSSDILKEGRRLLLPQQIPIDLFYDWLPTAFLDIVDVQRSLPTVISLWMVDSTLSRFGKLWLMVVTFASNKGSLGDKFIVEIISDSSVLLCKSSLIILSSIKSCSFIIKGRLQDSIVHRKVSINILFAWKLLLLSTDTSMFLFFSHSYRCIFSFSAEAHRIIVQSYILS